MNDIINLFLFLEKAEKIRAAMVGFKLPTTHVPQWAKVRNFSLIRCYVAMVFRNVF